jgi:hypothetical protein
MGEYENDVFISYSRVEKAFARQLEASLEAFHPPADLAVPQRRLVAFRDEQDFTGVEYYEALQQHLEHSAKLIVVCSPEARRSGYVNDEIRRFAAARGHDNIIPVLLAGIPNNEADPANDHQAAFPDALVEIMAMPLAADFRGFDTKKDRFDRGPFQNAWYTLLANIYGVSRREIEDRDRRRQARERRKRRILAAITAGVVGTLLIGGTWYYESYVHSRTELYRHVELRAGEPVTFGPTQLEDARARESTVQITRKGRRGPIQMIENIDGLGLCTPPRTNPEPVSSADQRSDAARPCRWFFDRDAGKNVIARRAYDRLDRLIWTQTFTREQAGMIVRAQYTRPDGTPLTLSNSKAEFIEIRLADAAGESELRYLSGSGAPVAVPEQSGIYGKRRRVGVDGMVAEEIYLGSGGQPLADKDSRVRVTFERDRNGSVTARRFFDAEDRPTSAGGGFHRESRRYDLHGNLIERSFFGTDDQPVTLAGGYHRIAETHDEQGRLTGWAYFDKRGTPVAGADGAHRVAVTIDRSGNRIAKAFFDDNDSANLNRTGYHREENRYDEQGNRIEWRYFDSSLAPISSVDGYHRGVAGFDSTGRQTEVAYFDEAGNPVIGSEGFHRMVLTYNPRGNVISIERLDTDGSAIVAFNEIWKILERRPAAATDGDQTDRFREQLFWLVELMQACKRSRDPTLMGEAKVVEKALEDMGRFLETGDTKNLNAAAKQIERFARVVKAAAAQNKERAMREMQAGTPGTSTPGDRLPPVPLN